MRHFGLYFTKLLYYSVQHFGEIWAEKVNISNGNEHYQNFGKDILVGTPCMWDATFLKIWAKSGKFFFGSMAKKWNVEREHVSFFPGRRKFFFSDFAQIFRKVASHIDKCRDSLFAGKYQMVRKLGPKYCGSRPKNETCFDTFCFLGSPPVNPP